MKILFIVPYPTEGPSNRFRIEQYLPVLQKSGATCSIRPFCNTEFYNILLKRRYYLKKFFYLVFFTVSRCMDVLRGMGYDAVFIHREAFPTKDYIFEWLFRKTAKVMIYDFDDSIFLKKPAKVKTAVSISDLVIAGNQFLKDYAVSLNNKIALIPTCIDTDKYRPSAENKSSEKVVIGWIGTHTTSTYLASLNSIFKTISERYKNVEFRIVGASGFDALPGLPFVTKNWSLDSEMKELKEFDIGIMPMPDNDWTKGKCAFKIIQYMSMAIPAVASPVGMNTEVIKDGINGFLAATYEEWRDKLSALIESPDLRGKIGANGRKTVEEKYSLKANAGKFIAAIERAGR